ncbi:FdhF/YdeP family oxidoreductase [Tautonia plasticadhaerens]|uniref:Formate dehydrogenase H n=1 Tax=Tautonia plasticadhaerens TaxID=2527974 RepID=A0A518HCA0_9BACT|nr:FdhF/YdeP family oxidoreductase [Tautonia plasticadhaerens]QDV38481.1 Formate dehydrogenase H [Tautonia plasticadhaerens]
MAPDFETPQARPPLGSTPDDPFDDSHGHPADEPPAEFSDLHLHRAEHKAAGPEAVYHAMKKVSREAGLVRGLTILTKVNQAGGFDCPSCAWPDPEPGDRASFEFCENGAKAVAAETTTRRVDRAFFARHSVAELASHGDDWLDAQGRLAEPMALLPGADHYEPIPWDDAFRLIADELDALDSPDEAVFYTSGRTSNEAAFLYQLFVRQYGTNNLPDCSNLCHESSGAALGMSLGVGKGSVRLEDFRQADLILLVGQNPGTNHPRMLTTLQAAVEHGAKLVAINPLKEAGLLAFAHPQHVRGMLGISTTLADTYLQVKINGDQALFRGLCKALFEEEARRPGEVIDRAFVDQSTAGFEEYRRAVGATSWDEIERRGGIDRPRIEALARRAAATDRIICCWAMGLTQHRNAVATIREVVNFLLLRGALGKPGSGVCPVRGHSNVQGDRTMGIWERMPDRWLDRLGAAFDFHPPRHHGFDTVQAISAMHEGRARVFFGLGGNFLSASPDTHYTSEALRRCRLTAQVSTKLNRAHLVTGRTALILPCLGRSERDLQAGGEQFVSVENSMGIVHQSHGPFSPASPHLLSEPAIVARLARAVLGDRSTVRWEWLVEDYDRIRDAIGRVVPGFDDYNARIRRPGGFPLDHPVRDRVFPTPDGKAHFSDAPLGGVEPGPGQLLLMTIRSHDQFNTTIYSRDDRYRGIHNERRVVFLNAEDMADLGVSPQQPVDLTGIDPDSHGRPRVARRFLAIPYDIPRGCAAAYFPEANVLVPIDQTAEVSNTPASKSILITVSPAARPGS